MILVTLGTQDKNFSRLLDAVQKQIDNGNIKDEVIVQAGCTKYQSKDMKIFDLLDQEEFKRLISECDLLITHGGVGSILTGLKNNKKVIAAARLSKYKEHMNDHGMHIKGQPLERGVGTMHIQVAAHIHHRLLGSLQLCRVPVGKRAQKPAGEFGKTSVEVFLRLRCVLFLGFHDRSDSFPFADHQECF